MPAGDVDKYKNKLPNFQQSNEIPTPSQGGEDLRPIKPRRKPPYLPIGNISVPSTPDPMGVPQIQPDWSRRWPLGNPQIQPDWSRRWPLGTPQDQTGFGIGYANQDDPLVSALMQLLFG